MPSISRSLILSKTSLGGQPKIRAEFFDTTPDVAIKALRTIGKGALYIFTDDDPSTVQKIDLLKEGVPDENVISLTRYVA